MKNRLVVAAALTVLTTLALMTGCRFFGLGAETDPTGLATSPMSGNANVAFRLLLPTERGTTPLPLAAIRPALVPAAAPNLVTDARVTFRLLLANTGNRLRPTEIFSRTVPVSASGSVQVTFNALPPRPVLAQLRLEGGHIQGWTDFHGAADLRSGDNVLELAPMGSGLFADLLGQLALRTLQSPDLVEKAGPNLVAQTVAIMQSLSGLSATTLGDAFDKVVEQLQPTGLIRLVPSSDRASVSGFGGTQKLWEKRNDDLWQAGEIYSANPADLTLYNVLFQGVGGAGYVAWKHLTSSSFGIVRLDAPTGNRLSFCRNPGLCDHALVLQDGSIIIGGRNEEKGCPVVFRWSGQGNAGTSSAAAPEHGLQWVRYLTSIGTGTVTAQTAVRGLQFDGRDTVLATVFDPVTTATRTFRLNVEDGSGDVAFAGTVVNAPPMVTLSAPLEGAVIKAGDDLTLTAEAVDPDGAVARVEFFAGSTRLGVATTTPFTCLWKGPAVGSYSLSATAVDNGQGVGRSAPVVIVVNATGLEPDSPYAPLDTSKIVANPQDKSLLIRDEVVVTFKTPPSSQEVAQVAAHMGGTVIASFPSIKTWQFRIGATEVNSLLNSVNSLQSEAVANHLDYHYDTHQVIQSVGLPNDPYFSQNWGLPRIQGTDAGDLAAVAVTAVAVVDTGVRRDHEDLLANLDSKNSRNFTADNAGDPADFDDGNGHGTHVAGIVAAARNNDIGLAGVAPQCRIVAVKVLGNDGKGSTLNIARGILHAADLEAVRVINLSLGGQGMIKRVVKEAIDYAVAHGKLVVVAAGNDNDDATFFNPAHYEKCLAVAATGQDDTRAYFSNYGGAVDVAAPGVGIFSCDSTTAGSYKKRSGTSMATPFVSGLAALLFSQRPTLTADQVRSLIQGNTDPLTTDFPVGAGRINVAKALAALSGTGGNQLPSVTVSGPTTVDAGMTVTFAANATDTDDPRVIGSWNSNAATKPLETTASDFSSTASWKAPDVGGWYFVSCRVLDPKGGASEHSLPVYVTPKLVTLNYLSPARGPIGADVAIFGHGFGGSEADGSIRFNGVGVTEIASWTPTCIVVRVPQGVTSGQVIVTVQGNPSNGLYFEVDEKPPIISSVRLAEVTKNSVTISWQTDEEASTLVDYGSTTAYGAIASAETGGVRNHVVTIDGLTPAGTWHFRVRSRDIGGYEGFSTDQTFTTLENVMPNVVVTSPTEGFTFGEGETVTIAANASDSDGTITRVEFSQDGNLLGSDTTAPYAWVWKDVPIGAYVLTARALDDNGAAAVSATVGFQVHAAPTVTITVPASGSLFTSGDTVTLTVAASATAGTIARVEFYQGSTKIGESSTPPFTFPWTNVPGGLYDLTARAIDNLGAGRFSTAVPIRVNTPPAVTISAPADGSYFAAGENVAITADAVDSDGTIARVEFFRNGVLLASDGSYPFGLDLPAVTPGTFVIGARVYDDLEASTPAASVTFHVGAPPSVVLDLPANGAGFTAGDNLTMAATATDTDGTVARVEFYADNVLVGSSTQAPFTFLWPSLTAGTHELKARAIDNSGAFRTSAVIRVSVNAPPTVSLTQPAANALFHTGGTIELQATASDPDGAVRLVRFFQGTTLIGEDPAAPYTVSWTGYSAGVVSLTAQAFDGSDTVRLSEPVSIRINDVPTVSLTRPAEGSGFTAGDSLTLEATASDTDGSVRRVNFYAGTTLVGSASQSPFTLVWSPLPAGDHQLTAVAVDEAGASRTSGPVRISVNALPLVQLTQPASNTLFHTGGTIELQASASDPEGAVTRVEFFQGTTLLGEDLSAPFSWTWTGFGGGAVSLTARAVDGSGTSRLSDPVPIRINTRPTVALTSPASDTVFLLGEQIPCSVTASDPDGGVSSVDYYAGDTWIGVSAASPFGFTWSSPAAGSYLLRARATDVSGGTTDSGAIPVIVNTPPTVSISSPAADLVLLVGARCTLEVNASDTDGTVSRVDFFDNGELVGSDSSSPFTWDFSDERAVGSQSFTVRAIDNLGAVATSATRVVKFSLLATGTILWPPNRFHVAAGSRVTFIASATTNTARVQYLVNGASVGNSTVGPEFAVTWMASSTIQDAMVVARILNEDGFSQDSNTLISVYIDDLGPTAAIASPAHDASVPLPPPEGGGWITLRAAASPTSGIGHISFYVNGEYIGMDDTSPYTCNWRPGVAGTYELTAERVPGIHLPTDPRDVSSSTRVIVY